MLSGLPPLTGRARSALAPTLIIACGVLLRLTLIFIGWPHSDSEEGTMGLEALHILRQGERPIYLYGQSYMGAIEAYMAALAFRVFGVSVVSLRLGMIAFYAIFMAGVFWLACQLYSRRVALVALVLLVLGTPFLVQIELLADGGKIETLAFGALMFAIASWLALHSSNETLAPRQRGYRYVAFATWGLLAGFGLYTYAIIAPFVLTSGVLLWLTCRREMRSWVLALPIIGLLCGCLPAVLYAASEPSGNNPIAVFIHLHQSLNANGAAGWHGLVKQVEATLLYTLPTVTGLVQLFPLQSLPFYGPLTPQTFASILIGGGWSLGYLALLAVATVVPVVSLRKRRLLLRQGEGTGGDTRPDRAGFARDVARLMLMATAWITIVSYMASPTAASNPYSGRYMIGLVVVLPAVLWPLVEHVPWPRITRPQLMRAQLAPAWRPVAVLLVSANLAAGALAVAQAVPGIVTLNRHDAKLADDLLSRGITRFYTDYWTCDSLMFATRERLVCGVVDLYGQPGFNRYPAHYAAVQADPQAPYVLVSDSLIQQTFANHVAQVHQRYAAEYLDGYIVNTPMPPPPS